MSGYRWYVCAYRNALAGLVLTILIFLAADLPAFGQVAGTGAINGTVTDATGAVIPNANVIAASVATGLETKQTSGSTGSFSLSPLVPGQYTVTVSAPGFSRLTLEHVTVDALQTVGLQPKLMVGSATEAITVKDEPLQLDTQNATMGATMENEEYTSLPLEINGGARDPTAFVYLEPGVQHGGVSVQTGIFSGTGSSGRLDEVYIDGLPQTSIYEQGDPRYVSNLVSVEAVDQFQVVTANPPAAYQGAGLENYVIKSAGNSIHGSVFDIARTTALDTWNFFEKATINPLTGAAVKPLENQNEYGASLGGPIRKNKIFFFANYDGFYLHENTNPYFNTIPTLAMRTGDFSQFTVTSASNPYPQYIYDPASCPIGSQSAATCVRTPFNFGGPTTCTPTATATCTNKIDPARIEAASQFMQKFLPAPLNSNTTNNYLSGIPSFQHHWSNMDHLDWALSDKHRISVIFGAQLGATYGFEGYGSPYSSMPIPYLSGLGFETKNKLVIGEDDYTITQHLVNQFKAGFTRFYGPVFNPAYRTKGYGLGTDGGVSGLPAGQASGSFPDVEFLGYNAPTVWNFGQDYDDITNYTTILDNVLYTKGRHHFTFGGTHQWLEVNDIPYTSGSSPAEILYSSANTAYYAGGTGNPITGHAYASFLLGQMYYATFTQESFQSTGARIRPTSLYAQDDITLTPNLVLNVGVRWDYFPSYQEVLDRSSFMNPLLTNPVTGNKGALQFAGHGPSPVYCNCHTPVNEWLKNFGPRLGFAYSFGPKTVLRGGYSISFTHGTGQNNATFRGTGTNGFSAAPAFVASTAGDSPFDLAQGFPAFNMPPTISASYGTAYTTLLSTPAAAMSYADPYLGSRAPYAVYFTLGVEQQLTKDISFQLNYVGSQGHFLPAASGGSRGIYSNELNPQYLALQSLLTKPASPTYLAQAQAISPSVALPYASFSGTLGQALLPFPQYTSVADTYNNNTNSNYNAMQVILKQRMSHDLDFMFNYTWSAEIDDNGTFRNGYLPSRVERSRGVIDSPAIVNATGVWLLPLGANQPFNSHNRFVRALISGYKLSGIYTYTSGNPLTVTASNCVGPVGSTCMPNINPAYSGNPRINGKYGSGITAATATSKHYVDVNAFIDPSNTALYPNYTIGNAPRTMPFGLRGPNSWNVNTSLKRDIKLHDRYTMEFDVEAFNLFNTFIASAPTVNTSTPSTFGVITSQANQSRVIQLGGRLNF